MNNEPVAWMAVNELNGSYSTFTNDQKQRLLPHVSQCYGKWIPLYTHPVKELTLTDGQINALDNEVKYSELSLYHHEYMRRFARLVLKKATNGEI